MDLCDCEAWAVQFLTQLPISQFILDKMLDTRSANFQSSW